MKKRPLLTRLMEKVQPQPNGCWKWTGSLNTSGYSQIYVNGKRPQAHRISYELFIGPIPKGMDLDHLCRNRDCVNPKHLEPVTRKENIARGEAGKYQKNKTHCPQGHPYDKKNTYHYKGRRNCRICGSAASLRAYHRQQQAVRITEA